MANIVTLCLVSCLLKCHHFFFSLNYSIISQNILCFYVYRDLFRFPFVTFSIFLFRFVLHFFLKNPFWMQLVRLVLLSMFPHFLCLCIFWSLLGNVLYFNLTSTANFFLTFLVLCTWNSFLCRSREAISHINILFVYLFICLIPKYFMSLVLTPVYGKENKWSEALYSTALCAKPPEAIPRCSHLCLVMSNWSLKELVNPQTD